MNRSDVIPAPREPFGHLQQDCLDVLTDLSRGLFAIANTQRGGGAFAMKPHHRLMEGLGDLLLQIISIHFDGCRKLVLVEEHGAKLVRQESRHACVCQEEIVLREEPSLHLYLIVFNPDLPHGNYGFDLEIKTVEIKFI